MTEPTNSTNAAMDIAGRIEQEWRCFHCGEVFTDTAAAQLHFGRNEMREPICHVDQVKFREMEALIQRYRDEDTDLHREVHRAHSDGQQAARKAEESGYAKGLGAYQSLEDAVLLALCDRMFKHEWAKSRRQYGASELENVRLGWDMARTALEQALRAAGVKP